MLVSGKRAEKVENLFDEYRKTGLALMTTIITLSSGGFLSLVNNEKTREYSFFYFIPIYIALLQMLTHYFASQKKAIAKYFHLTAISANDGDKGMDAYVDYKESFEKAKLLYSLSDKYCWFSCISLGLVTIYPIALFGNQLVLIVIFLFLLGCIAYWLKSWYTLKHTLARTNWHEPEDAE